MRNMFFKKLLFRNYYLENIFIIFHLIDYQIIIYINI
jgi:hypothetical protein